MREEGTDRAKTNIALRNEFSRCTAAWAAGWHLDKPVQGSGFARVNHEIHGLTGKLRVPFEDCAAPDPA
jgi:hypothetical protein